MAACPPLQYWIVLMASCTAQNGSWSAIRYKTQLFVDQLIVVFWPSRQSSSSAALPLTPCAASAVIMLARSCLERSVRHHAHSISHACRTLQRHVRCLATTAIPTFPGAEVRHKFLDFFAANDHTIVPSSSVVPRNDASLLFVNAGMNQFKDVLLGKEEPSKTKVANSQKCIRAGGKHNDLDEVGHDGRHHTYFEMLGNWSFGDYFQKEACTMAYDLLTNVYKLPKESLFITYFGGEPEVGLGPDFECREIWREIGVAENHILPLGMEDNFWAMGEEGPCGPCTEIHYSPSGDPAHMLELWNLVFMQFNRTRRGILEPLQKKHVDTGMGLERIVAVLQGKTSNYDTDLFLPLLRRIEELTKAPPYQPKMGKDDHEGMNTAYRILADHARMLTVAIADGMVPGDRGAPFVLRKVLRRAALTLSTKFSSDPTLLTHLVPTVTEILGTAYPEISENEGKVKAILGEEVKKYVNVLSVGSKAFRDICKKLENKMLLPADKMFTLYASHGVPEELILSLAKERNMRCDLKGFYQLVDADRTMSRQETRNKQQTDSEQKL